MSKDSNDDEIFFRRERKNIHTIFNLFNELPMEESRRVAEFANEKIESRTISAINVNQMN
jgi:hypothetical protein